MKMINSLFKIFIAVFLIYPIVGCRYNSMPQTFTPPKILWAWERPENLEFLDAHEFGVAFLAQTLELQGGETIINPRRQPLKVNPAVKLIAVTRIETGKRTGEKADLSDSQIGKIVEAILKTTAMKNISAVQIDFDAAASERDFYRRLLENLRQKLPNGFPLSITTLASFCLDDDWIRDLPVDEFVPMIFRLGADEKIVKNFLAGGNDFPNSRCRTSYGIAADEPIKANLPEPRRVYFFNVRSWTKNDVDSLTLPSVD